MTYKDEWKGKLKVINGRRIEWLKAWIGNVYSEHSEGAKSPGGMVTNIVWLALSCDGDNLGHHASQTLAIQTLIDEAQRLSLIPS